MDTLLAKLGDWKPFRAVVVGDYMLDQLLCGDAERLSADAPVPVLHVRSQENRPGGAANVCLDLVAMRGEVVAVGVVGEDADGAALCRSLEAAGVDASGLVVEASRPTTVKRSLIGLAQARHPQKMFRLDVESREALGSALGERVVAAAARALEGADVLCIEDYGKGVCTEVVCRELIRLGRAAGVPVLIDPAGDADYAKYRGATAVTPNRTEAERATGLRTHAENDPAHNGELARALLDRLELDAVVLTLDRHGALLLESGAGGPVAIPTVARSVYDVTGAGDMMLAGLAAALANGLAFADAVRFANAAAGLEVEVFGVVPIPLERIHHELLRLGSGWSGKLRTDSELDVELAAARRAGKRVVFTNGCFDVLHAGHVTLLERAREMGDYLVVGLNSDESVRGLKGAGRPVNTEADRAHVLGALSCVDAVVVFGEATPLRLIERVRPDVLVKGADYTGREVVGADVVLGAGGRVELVDLLEGRSTSRTIERIRANA